MFWLICVLIISSFILYVKWKNRRLAKVAEQIPYASFRKVPILGHALSFRGDCADIMRNLEQFGRDSLANGGVACIWVANKLVIAVTDPDIVEVVMKTCLEKDDTNDFAQRLLGHGSIFAPVPIWRRRRKILALTFAPKTINSFFQIFAKQSQILLDALKEDVGKGDVSLFDRVTRYSLDSVCETTLGTEVNSQRLHEHPVPQAFALHCKLGVQRAVRPWYHSDAVYRWSADYAPFNSSADVMQDFVRKIIKTKRQHLSKLESIPTTDKEVNKVQSLVDLLMSSEDGKGFSDLEMQEESLVVVLAGTDTSSVGASFTALLMAKHPRIQEKVYQEPREPPFVFATGFAVLVDLHLSSEDGKGFTDLEMQEESLVVVAGTDTSSVGVSFTALLMAKHPRIQEKVYQEALQVLGDRPVQKEDLPKLKYLEVVLKEALRLYPPVPIVIKRPSNDLTLPNGVTIVPGRLATVVNIWAVHRNTKYWGADAERFRPERFFENPPTHPYAYIPFGKGPRMCLGAEYAMMSMKTVLVTLVRRYRFLPPAAGFGPGEDLPTSFEVMMKHVGNFQLQLQFRNK